MLALHPRTVDAVWAAVEPLIPVHRPNPHPLGCHRRRIANRVCFEGILRRLVTGCSWDVAGRISGAGETTLRRRRTEWIAAGVFEELRVEATAAYDRIIGLDLSEVAVDGSQHKAPFGGEGTGPNPTDRGKSGWKWSLATDRVGVRDAPGLDLLAEGLEVRDVRVLPVPSDCVDGFGAAYWARPEAYTDPAVQAGMSWLALLSEAERAAGTRALRGDLANGEWHWRHGHLLEQTEFDGGHRLAIAGG